MKQLRTPPSSAVLVMGRVGVVVVVVVVVVIIGVFLSDDDDDGDFTEGEGSNGLFIETCAGGCCS